MYFVTVCTQNRANLLADVETVGEMVQWLKTQTTNEYIKLVKSGVLKPFDKHIWQRSFYEHVIRNENDLYETRRYIEGNPVNWIKDKYYG